MGPGQYHASNTQTKHKAFTFKINKSDVGPSEKSEFQERLKARFDGSGATIKKNSPHLPKDLKTLEERISVPLFGDEPGLKGVSSFVSSIKRENRLLIDGANPSPD